MVYLFSEIVASGGLLRTMIYESELIDGLSVETAHSGKNSQIAPFNF
jgi:hypothetical protein